MFKMDLFFNIKDSNKLKLLRFFEADIICVKKNTTVSSMIKNKKIIASVIFGKLQVIKQDYNGNRTLIDELIENDVFGSIMQTIYGDEYDIVAKEDSKVFIIDFNNAINVNNNTEYYNQFLKNLLQIMSKKILDNNERIEILTNKSIRNKLLAYFKMMYRKNNSKVIYLPFSLTDLADYLCVDRSAMSRELKNLKDEGFIEIKNKKIKLLY